MSSYPFTYFVSGVSTKPSIALGFHTFLTVGIKLKRRNHGTVCYIAEQSLGKEALITTYLLNLAANKMKNSSPIILQLKLGKLLGVGIIIIFVSF